MRIGLLTKLLLLNALLMTLVLVAVWLAIELHAADYFMTLMKKFDVDAPEVNEMFLWANRNSLLYVALGAGILGTALSFWFTRRLLAPLQAIGQGTGRVARGDYSCRVADAGADELGDLSRAFNAMAGSLERMERLRRGMVVDVAHELRTPLNNLRGCIEALQDGLLEPDARVFGTLHSELLRLVRLTEDLLHAARDAEAEQSQRQNLDAVSVLSATLDLFRPRLERRRVRIVEHLAGDPMPVLANGDQLTQVYTNLLQNCLQFAPEDSWIKLRAVRRHDRVRLVFSNPGAPIAGEDLPWIFEPYFRPDRSRSREQGGGAGIGLAIVRVLVEAHGGTVGASSDAEVTRVWVELPRLAAG